MKKLQDYLNEASISYKKKMEKFAKSMFKDETNFKLFRTLGIVTAENEFKKELKRNHLQFILIKGKFAGNEENTILIINPSIDIMKYFAGKFEQTSFFFCLNDGKDTIAEYWEKTDTTTKYDKKLNDYKKINSTNVFIQLDKNADEYTIIGDDFKFLIDASVFSSVHESIENNLNKYFSINEQEYALFISTNGVGQASLEKRKLIYD
jgi:hypothetical protein